jgi:phage/conjugal plasmid C-4 type zinc finger TraR family protein
MAGGFAKDGAVQDQIDASIEDAVQHARRQIPQGESLERCEQCDAGIPEARRKAIPGVRLCVRCQSEADDESRFAASINRRGSKDSQLR